MEGWELLEAPQPGDIPPPKGGTLPVDHPLTPVLERIAVANEKLIELATEERSVGEAPGPPFCPNCMSVNPDIRNDGGGGPMADYVLKAQCQECKNFLFAVPEGWRIFSTPEEAKEALEGGGK